jgi:hypothetical protein
MANQMIALQARNPQLPDPARATTQMANMMNMASQQRAAQLQGERIRQEMEYARAGESRAEETQRLNVRKEDQAFRVAGMKELRNRGLGVLQSGSEEAYQLLLKQTEAIDPDSAAVMRQVAPTLGDGKALRFFITEADKFIDKNTSQRKTEIEYDEKGIPIVVDFGGDTEFEASPLIVTKLRDVNQPPRATPTAPPASAMERDPSAVSAAPMTFGTDAERPLNAYQQEDLDRLETELGMKNTAASFTGMGGAAQMTPDVMSRIVDSAFETGVMAQVDFDQLLASQPPQNKQALMDTFQRANIRLQADAPSLADSGMGQQQQMAANPVQRPQAGFADFRGPTPPSRTAGLGGDMPMERTLAQYRVGDPIRGKNPSVAPFPAAAQVPPSVLAAQEAAKTTAQEQAKEAAAAAAAPALAQRERNVAFSKERGTADAKFMESASSVVEASNEGRNILNQMIGDAYIDKRGKIVVPKDGRRPHSGFEGVVGLGFPGMRFVPGSPEADFDKKFKQVVGKAFLKAFNDLRGGGSITEIEGVKATEAITRLSRSISEVEFIRAARELEDILAKGEQRALDRRARIEGKAAPRVSTPTSKKSKPRELVFNPATGDFD